MTLAAYDESARAARLLDAQDKAEELFAELSRRELIRPGVTESAASNAIRDLAGELLGIRRYWHKRIVRSGPNTLLPYRKNPPDRLIEDDDIAFADFGPIFEEWEADFGRTFVLGPDPVKHRLHRDLTRLWSAGRAHFDARPDITGEQLYARMTMLAEEAGWEFGGEIAGHLVGEFPHEKITGDDIESYIAPGSDQPMRGLDRTGRVRHWILEIHLVDRERQIGGFQEELLDLDRGSTLRSRAARGQAWPEPGPDRRG